jgi:hypothetical protein
MDLQEMLFLVKQKLFEPRKRVVSDVFGNKTLEFSSKPVPIGLTGRDKELFDAADGWNVADKDYVDWKIGEARCGMSSKVSSSNVFFVSANVEEGVATFFYPGILFKKDHVLEEFALIFSSVCTDDCSLILKSSTDVQSKPLLVQKIKTGSQIMISEPKFRMESSGAVFFQLKFSKKTLQESVSLQITTSA